MLVVDFAASHTERFLNHCFVIFSFLDEWPFALLTTDPDFTSCFVPASTTCDGVLGPRRSHSANRFFQLLDVFQLVVGFTLLTILLLELIVIRLVVLLFLPTLLVTVVISTLIKSLLLGHGLILPQSLELLLVLCALSVVD